MRTPSAKLLILDDEAALMKALCDTLQPEGYETVGFTSASEALAALGEQSFDVMLTDLMMPEMDGVSALAAAFQIDPNLVGIVMTGHGSVNTAVNALKTGALDYILKPFKLSTITPVLSRAIAVRRLRVENIELREAVSLYGLSMAIASARDSEIVLQKIADAAFDQSKALGLSVLLSVEPDATDARHELYVAATRGSNAPHPAGARVPDQPSRPGFSVPMHSGGKLVGMLVFKLANRSFTVGQRKALDMLASTGASALAAALSLERLRLVEDRYRHLAEDAPDVVSRYEIHPELRCSYTNQAVITATGHTPDDFYAQPELALEVIHPEDRALAEKALRGDLADCGPLTLRWVGKNGTVVWMEQRTKLVYDRQGALTAVETVSRDITERRNLEERLRQSQKLEAVGMLTAGIAHDFNNLLTIINGNCALALRDAPPSSSISRMLDQIRRAGDQAAEMTNQLLAFSRKQVLQPRVLSLSALLEDMNPMVRRMVGDSVQVSVATGPDLGTIRIDPTQAQQVILNLAVNAKDAMAGRGKLRFELSNVDWEQARRQVPDIAPGNYVMLTVADNGCGMPEKVKQRAFEPFFTTKELGKGTGLGLATVHGIVEQSGGHIHIDSVLGQGTTFTILLPRSTDAALERPRESPVSLRGNETILLVEDNPGVRALTSDVLTSAGYVVLAAEDGPAALQLAKTHGAKIDLLLTDISLPGMPGTAVAEKVLDLCSRVKILFISGYTEIALPKSAAGADEPAEFLAKPFSPAELSARVRKVLEHRPVRSPNFDSGLPVVAESNV